MSRNQRGTQNPQLSYDHFEERFTKLPEDNFQKLKIMDSEELTSQDYNQTSLCLMHQY